uniref:Uncharacterized protein n=1 Tax=viral metagenome TaxID=1070528 RepID=A0A6H2A5N9_9ZZZZ
MKKGDLVRLNAKARLIFQRMKDTGPWRVLAVDKVYDRVKVERTAKSGKKRSDYWSMLWLELVEEGDVHE